MTDITISKSVEALLPPDSGFILMVFPFSQVAQAQVYSNAIEADYIYALRQFLHSKDAQNN